MAVEADTSLNLSRVQSPRPETPEPNSRQGRRNEGIQLLNDEGSISEAVRYIIFSNIFPILRNANIN